MGDRLLLGACSGFRTGTSGILRLTAVSAAYGGCAGSDLDVLSFDDPGHLLYAAGGRLFELDPRNGGELSSRTHEGDLCGIAADGRTAISLHKERAVFLTDVSGVRGPMLEGIDTKVHKWDPAPMRFAGGVVWGTPGDDFHKRVHSWDAASGRELLGPEERLLHPVLCPSPGGTHALIVWELRMDETILSRVSLAEPELREIGRFPYFGYGGGPRKVVADAALTHVVLEGHGGVAVVEAASGKIVRKILLGGDLFGLAASDDLRVLACLVDRPGKGRRLEIHDSLAGRVVGVVDEPPGIFWSGGALRVCRDGSAIAIPQGLARRRHVEIAVWDLAASAFRTWPDTAQRLGRVETLRAGNDRVTAAGSRTAAFDAHTLDEVPFGDADSLVRTLRDTEEQVNVIAIGERRLALRMGEWSIGGFEREEVTPRAERVLAICEDPPLAITMLPCAVLETDIYTSDSGNVATASELYLWDLAAPDAPPRLVARLERLWLEAAAFSPDGAWIGWLAQEGPMHLLDAKTLAAIETVPFPSLLAGNQKFERSTDLSTAIAIAPGRRHWAVAIGAVVMLRHAGVAEPIDVVNLSSAEDQVTSLAFSPSGDALFAGTRRGAVLRFEITEGR